MFSIITLLIQVVIWAFTFAARMAVIAAHYLWEFILQIAPPLQAKFGEAHEKSKRKMLIESVESEKWGDCFNRLLEYRDICFGEDNAEARVFEGNVSVRYQMEQAIKEEFGMNIGKYMESNNVEKLGLLLADMEQYILGNVQPSKKYQKMHGKSDKSKNNETDDFTGHTVPGNNNTYSAENTVYGDGRNNAAAANGDRSMPAGYFADCRTQSEVRARFNELNNTFNPDFGTSPNEAMYRGIVEQYKQALNVSQN